MKLELPTLQNWSCHSCGGCCTQHGIFITEAEKERIEKQGWDESTGIPKGQSLFVKMGGWFGRKWHRLAHQPSGACVFLDEKNLCRIHARFGEPAKPLACRIYPYAFHPAGKGVTVGLRFSCPSVVANLGKPVSQQRGDILDLAKQVVPANVDQAKPPRINASSTVTWPDFHQFVQALDETLADSERPFIQRLLIALGWVAIVEQASFEKLSGGRITEFLGIVRHAATESMPENIHEIAAPSSVGRTQFRLLAGHYARKDRYGTHRHPFAGRLRLLTAALKLTSGKGTMPEIQPGLKPVPFEQLDQPFGVPPEANELFERYFRVKIQGLSFCGAAYYHEPFVEGFQSLALMYPAVLWLARWIAAGHGRTTLALEDVADALAIADHHHGYSPALGTWGFRRRVRNLAILNDIAALCAWYSR